MTFENCFCTGCSEDINLVLLDDFTFHISKRLVLFNLVYHCLIKERDWCNYRVSWQLFRYHVVRKFCP